MIPAHIFLTLAKHLAFASIEGERKLLNCETRKTLLNAVTYSASYVWIFAPVG